jgi:SAM-dependent methyltransferase
MTAATGSGDFVRYLLAKKTVDDRALSRDVLDALRTMLRERHGDQPLRVLEIGAGIGTMLERLLTLGMFTGVEYTLLDNDRNLIDVAQERLRSIDRIQVEYVVADAFDFIHQNHRQRTWDLIVAHAFLDLTDVAESVPGLLGLIEPGGGFYFTVNYNGKTSFAPEIDSGLDEHIERLYDESMRRPGARGVPSGGRTGRDLIVELQRAGATIRATGASDWIVYANEGAYAGDEAYFLRFILGFVESALRDHPELDPTAIEHWLRTRHDQIDRGELVYIAHQIDVAGRS